MTISEQDYGNFLLEITKTSMSFVEVFNNENVKNHLMRELNKKGKSLPAAFPSQNLLQQLNSTKSAESQRNYIITALDLESGTPLDKALDDALKPAPAQASTLKENKRNTQTRKQTKKKETNGQSLYDAFMKRPDIQKSSVFETFLKNISEPLINALNAGIKLPSEQEIMVMFSKIQELGENRFNISKLIISTFALTSQDIEFMIIGKLLPETVKALQEDLKKINRENEEKNSQVKSTSIASSNIVDEKEKNIDAPAKEPDEVTPKKDPEPRPNEQSSDPRDIKSETKNDSEPAAVNPSILNEAKIPDAPDNVVKSRKTIMPMNIQEAIDAMQNKMLKHLLSRNVSLLASISPAGKNNPSNKDLTDIFDNLAQLNTANDIELELRFHNLAQSDNLTKLSNEIHAINMMANFDYEEEKNVPSVNLNPPQPEPGVEENKAQPMFAGVHPPAENEPEPAPLNLPRFNRPEDQIPDHLGPLPVIDDEPADEPAPAVIPDNEQKLNDFIRNENIQNEFLPFNAIITNPQVKQAIFNSWDNENTPPSHEEYIYLLNELSLSVSSTDEANEAIATLFHLPELTIILQNQHLVDLDSLSFVANQVIEARNLVLPPAVPVPAAGVAPGNNGQVVFNALIANPQIAAMTTLIQVLNDPNVNQHLIDYWNIPGSLIPTPEILITALASAGNSAAEMRNALIRNFFLITPGAQPPHQAVFFNVALNEPNNINTNLQANNIRGEARYQKLINDPAIPQVATGTLIGNFLRNPQVKTDLTNHWKTIGNNPPNQASINTLIAAFSGPALTPVQITAAFENVFGVGALQNSAAAITATAAAIAAAAVAALAVPPLAAAAPAAVAPAALTGQNIFDNLINNPLLAPLTKLREALTKAAVQTYLINYWNNPATPAPDANTLINAVIAAHNAAGVRDVIANLTTPPANLLTIINTSGILADTVPLANNIRSEAIYQQVISDPAVLPAGPLPQFLQSASVKTALINYWNTFTNAAPAAMNIANLINTLRADPAPATPAVRAAFDTAFGAGALPASTFDAQDRLVALLRGSAPYNTFVTSANFLNMPQTFQVIIRSPNISDILTRHWSTNTPPTDINTLLESLDPELGLDAAATRRAIANAFGNPPGLVAALAGAGINDNDPSFEEIKDQAKGFILVEKLLENPAIAAMPEIKALFEANPATKQLLARRLVSANPPDMRTLPTQIITELAKARSADEVRNVFNNPNEVFKVNLNITPASLNNNHAATLRGQARLQQLLSAEKNTAILNDMPALAKLLNNDTWKEDVINQWGNFHHINSIEKHIVRLRNALANAETVTDAQNVLNRFSPRMTTLITNSDGTVKTELVNTLRTQAKKSAAENDPEYFKQLRSFKMQAITNIRTALLEVDINNPTTLQTLNTSIQRIVNYQHLNTNHELYKAAVHLQTFFTRDGHHNINGIDGERQIEFEAALETAKAAQQNLMNRVNLLYETNANTPDQGLNAYENAAIYHQQQMLKNPDENEATRTEAICKSMQDDLELAESKILDRIEALPTVPAASFGLYADRRKSDEVLRQEAIDYRTEMLVKIKECRANLKETIGNIEENRALQTNAKKVNCYSDQSELVENSNERIMEKVIAYQQHGATPRSANNGVMSARVKAEIAHTKPFGAKARVNYTELTNRDGSTARFVSVQRTQGKLFKSELYHNPQDFETLDTLNLIKLAAREVENFYAAIPENKGYRLNLQGNMHPKFADAIIGYCKLKGYPKPFSSIPKYEPTNNSRYHRHFEDIYKQNEKQILTNTGDVSHIALTKESVDKLDKTVGAPPAEQPPRP